MNQGTKQCQNCKNDFVIESDDFEFYEKIKVPPPTFCPDCRFQRRLMLRNERALYKRVCSLCQKNFLALYSSDKPQPVYCTDCWWSDKWDGVEYGKEYDFSKSFFQQYKELMQKVPVLNLWGWDNIDSDYASFLAHCKNVYLSFSAISCEDVFYSYGVDKSKNIFDSFITNGSELCFENINTNKCYSTNFIINSRDCVSSAFLFDCVNCQNCFLCTNLRNKSYCIRNKQYSKEEYVEKINEIFNGSYEALLKAKEEFGVLMRNTLHKFASLTNAVNCTGDEISNSKNLKNTFIAYDSENANYGWRLAGSMKDCYDFSGGLKSELVYEAVTAASGNYFVKFYNQFKESKNCDYCILGSSCSNLFGCIGLRNKQYCILNKQYTKEEYEQLVPKIIEHMNEMPYISQIANSQGQIVKEIIYKYGEFFPSELSPFSYNETIAQEYFPLTKEQAIEQGYTWKDAETRNIQPTITSEQLPDHIKDVDDTILKQVIECQHNGTCNEQCTTAFKIIPQELEFYRKMNLPLPRLCPNCRHYQRIKQRNPLKLWHRKCMCNGNPPAGGANGKEQNVYTNTITHTHGTEPCTNEFQTTYAPERPEIIYCEQCYNAEIV